MGTCAGVGPTETLPVGTLCPGDPSACPPGWVCKQPRALRETGEHPATLATKGHQQLQDEASRLLPGACVSLRALMRGWRRGGDRWREALLSSASGHYDRKVSVSLVIKYSKGKGN